MAVNLQRSFSASLDVYKESLQLQASRVAARNIEGLVSSLVALIVDARESNQVLRYKLLLEKAALESLGSDDTELNAAKWKILEEIFAVVNSQLHTILMDRPTKISVHGKLQDPRAFLMRSFAQLLDVETDYLRTFQYKPSSERSE